MSSIQKRLCSEIQISEMDPFDMVSSYFVNEDIDVDKLERTIQTVVSRHEILRTGLLIEKGEFKQEIHDQVEFHIKRQQVETIVDVDTFIQNAICRFDLEKPPLMEVLYIESKGKRPLLVFHFHHTVADGISMAVFVEEVSALMQGKILQPVEKQYREYADWEDKYARSEKYQKDKEFWMDSISSDACSVDLSKGKVRNQNSVFSCETVESYYDTERTEALKKLGRENGASIFMVLLSGINLLLHKVACQKKVVLITPTTNRFESGFEKGIGMFTNMGVLSSVMEEQESVKEYIKKVKIGCLQAYRHFNYPFNHIVNDLKLNNSKAFNVGIVYENTDARATQDSGMDLEHIEFIPTAQEYDLKFEILEEAGTLHMYVRYREDVFSRKEAVILEQRLSLIYEQMTENPEKMVGNLEIAKDTEKHLILNVFNQTATEYPKEKTIVELYEEQVKRTPEQIALIYQGGQMTYQEMNARVNQLAHSLRLNGITRDDRVILFGDRSLEFLIGMYGVMKAGGAYVPVDPTHPMERIEYIIKDSQAKLVLTEGEAKELKTDIPVWNLQDPACYAEQTDNPERVNTPSDLIYCIYTSGTTGKPKGVMVEHHSVVNYTYYSKLYFSENNKIIPLFTNCCFDLAGTPLFVALCYGSTLEIIGVDKELDITKYLQDEKYDCLKMTPSHLKMALESKHYEKLKTKKHIVVGGELLDVNTVASILERYGQNLIFHNEYGPTEATIGATAYLCNGHENDEKIYIGKPLDNVNMYVMNGNVLSGIGVVGELCIGGDCLARGYMNLPELTSKKFVKNPFSEGMLYRTGDLASWTEDGNLEYIVRADEQVKIRGFRIELGEVEHAMHQIPEIDDATVSIKENSLQEKVICAYFVAQEKIDTKELRLKLGKKIPEYMLPAFIMQIDKMPVTKNGKVDKGRLPDIIIENEFEEPVSEAEKVLCEICRSVLGIKQVGNSHNFFALGGDSIKAIRIASKMAEKGYEISIKDIMRQPSMRDIAARAVLTEKEVYEQGNVTGVVVPTPIMKEFESLHLAKPFHYNQAVMYCMNKKKAEGLEEAVKVLVEHHDMLRAIYKEGNLEVIKADYMKPVSITRYSLDGMENVAEWIENQATVEQGKIDLEQGPLIRLAVFEEKEQCHVLMCIHHLVVDGISWRILSEDLMNILDSLEKGKKAVLPEKTASFIQWSQALSEYSQSSVMRNEKNYWKEVSSQIANGAVTTEDLADVPGCKTVEFDFTEELTAQLLHECNQAFHTEINDLLLTVIGQSVHKLTGQNQIAVGLEGHGREELHRKIDIYRTVGWFTCKYPVIVNWKENYETFLIETKEMLHRVPNHGIGYGLVAEQFGNPEISLYFNYMGEMDVEEGMDYLSDYSTGQMSAKENKQKGSININMLVSKKRLKTSISYDRSKHAEFTIEKLKQNMIDSIYEVVEFCTGKDSAVKTASDYGANDMQTEEFAELMDMFD